MEGRLPAWGDMSMINDVYNKKILGLAADIPLLRRLPDADASAVAHSKLCGSKVTVDVKMAGGVVTDFGHDVKACALGRRHHPSWRGTSSVRAPTT